MKMKIVNLTPHTLNIAQRDGTIFELASSGNARCKVKEEEVETINQISIYTASYGEVSGLPEPEPEQDTVYIVSLLVAQAVASQQPERDDVFSPGELIRDDNGRPVGCVGLRLAK
jgi:hypothetical protein